MTIGHLKSSEKKELFEREIAQFFSREKCLTVSSYRVGLYYSLKALNLKEGDEVLISSITIPDTINAIMILGLKPVFVDLSLDSHAIDSKLIAGGITKRSRVLLVTYLSGIVPDVLEYKKIAKENNLVFIEDFSQNYMAQYDNVYCGKFGDISIGSLSSGKILSTVVGGIILSDDVEFANKIEIIRNETQYLPRKEVLGYYLKNCIIVSIATKKWIYKILTHTVVQVLSFFSKTGVLDFEHEPRHKNNIFYTFIPIKRTRFPEGFFSVLTDWQAEFGLKLLKEMPEGTRKRKLLAKIFFENLKEESKECFPSKSINHENSSYYHLPIYCFYQKEELRRYLFRHGIDNGSYGLNLNHLEKCFGFEVSLPISEIIKNDTIFIPINEKYTPENMIYIANLLNKFWSEHCGVKKCYL